MDCIIEIALNNTNAGTVERLVHDVMDLVSGNGFKGVSREVFAAGVDAHAALARITNGQATVRVCKVE